MRSASETLFSTLLAILTLMILLSLLTEASPLPAPTSANGSSSSGDALVHHITRSRYCGRKLTETLSMLCQGRYPMMGHHRAEYLSDQPQQPVEVEVATLPDNGATHGFPYSRSSGGHHRRVRRAGIYEECCKKSCSYQELRRYCE